MRIAALAFGVVAGLVASLILALGGLDAAALIGVDPRQLSLVRFGLFIIANFGVLGAGLVLASPLAGAILFILGAIAWIAAAVVLHHGPDYVMLVPPGLLLVSAVFAVVAFVRKPQPDYDEYGDAEALAAQRAAMASSPDMEEEDPGAVPVGATFFGNAGTATPMHGAMARAAPEPQYRSDRSDTWEPVRRRTEPPRQKPLFRSVEEDYDDETGFWRISRFTSSILSFGLYGALAAAAVLIFLNLRTGTTDRPSATKIEASAVLSSKLPPSSSAAPSQVARAPALRLPLAPSSAEVAAVAPALIAPSSAPPVASTPPATQQPGVVVVGAGEPPSSSLPSPSAPSSALSEAPPSASEPPSEDLTLGEQAATGPLMPFPMSPQMAAGRTKSPARPVAPAPPRNDTGL